MTKTTIVAAASTAGTALGYALRGLTDKWLMWRQYRKGGWFG